MPQKNHTTPCIAVFDSGLGGLTVMRALRQALPYVPFLYLGDTARLPYGNKSPKIVQHYAERCAKFLASKGATHLIIACNTASAHALSHLRQQLSIPVLGVIEPGVQAALKVSPTRRIGLLATVGTVRSNHYGQRIGQLAPDAILFSQASPLLAPLAEEGLIEHPATHLFAAEYLQPLLAQQIDTLILGCTHYPVFRPVFERLGGPSLHMIDSAQAIAQQVQQWMQDAPVTSIQASIHCYFTDRHPQLEQLVHIFLGEPLQSVEWIDLI